MDDFRCGGTAYWKRREVRSGGFAVEWIDVLLGFREGCDAGFARAGERYRI
jgi:hypothetical protein